MTKFLISFRVFYHNTKYFLYISFNLIYFYIKIYSLIIIQTNFAFFKRHDIFLILQKLKLTFQK